MKKNLLIIGNSAKESALAKILSESFNIYVASGNHSIEEFATIVDIRENNVAELAEFALENDISFTICCSESAIINGITKVFEMNGLQIFAPTDDAAKFCTSKIAGKKMMYKLRIPTPRFGTFDKKNLALDYLKNCEMPIVIKTDNHIGNNGVMVCPTENIAKSYIEDCYFSGEEKILIEDYVYGTDFSFYVITDGYKALPIGSTVDYKFSLEGNGGLMTEGMGAYSPCNKFIYDQIDYLMNDIVYPVIDYQANNGTPYIGIIGFDGVLTSDGRISIIECNTFLKDHDAQCVLSLLDDDIYKLMEACVIGSFSDEYDYVQLKDEFAVSGVLSSGKYKDGVIIGLDELQDNTFVAHFNTKKNEYLEYLTQGGRTLLITKIAKTLSRAKQGLYEELEFIDFQGKQYRKDICPACEE